MAENMPIPNAEPSILANPPVAPSPATPPPPPGGAPAGAATEALAKVQEELARVKAELVTLKEAIPASTSPPSSAPHAPAPGVVSSVTAKWEALRASGDRAAAELFFMMHRDAINRFA
jgi:hypothetical protein